MNQKLSPKEREERINRSVKISLLVDRFEKENRNKQVLKELAQFVTFSPISNDEKLAALDRMLQLNPEEQRILMEFLESV